MDQEELTKMADIEDNVDLEAKYGSLDEILKSNDPTKMPSTKELLQMLETSNIPEEMKENLKTMLTGSVPKVFGGYGSYLAVLFVILIFSILRKFSIFSIDGCFIDACTDSEILTDFSCCNFTKFKWIDNSLLGC